MNPYYPSTRTAAPVALLLLALAPGCDESQPTSPGEAPRPVILLNDITHLKSDSYRIDEMSVMGQTLGLQTTVGGGCAPHDYDLYFSRDFAESFPVQTWAYLVHRSRDMCDALLTHRRDYDLRPLIDHYVATYGQEDPIIIHIYPNSTRSGPRLTIRYEPWN